MQNLKTSFWVSCCIHAGVFAGILCFASSLKQRDAAEPSTVIELVSIPEVTPPKLIEAPVLPVKPIEERPPAPLPLKEEKPALISKPEPPKQVEVKEKPKPVVMATITPVPVSITLSETAAAPALNVTAVESGSSIKESPEPTAGHGILGIFAQPRYRENPEPMYPLTAKRRHQEGTVVLLVAVNANGKAEAVNVKESSGFSTLDDAARDAVTHWKFDPARAAGEPVASKVEVPVRFQLVK